MTTVGQGALGPRRPACDLQRRLGRRSRVSRTSERGQWSVAVPDVECTQESRYRALLDGV